MENWLALLNGTDLTFQEKLVTRCLNTVSFWRLSGRVAASAAEFGEPQHRPARARAPQAPAAGTPNFTPHHSCTVTLLQL